jgi:hypothetical protein
MANATADLPKATELLADIGRDLRTIAADELELTHSKLKQFLERQILKAGIAVLGATVALIGLAMLCVVAVVVLAPIIPELWLRLLLMAAVYIGLGGSATYVSARRILATHGPKLDKQISEIGETVDAIRQGLKRRGQHAG